MHRKPQTLNLLKVLICFAGVPNTWQKQKEILIEEKRLHFRLQTISRNDFSNRTYSTQPQMREKSNINNNQHNRRWNRFTSKLINEITRHRLQNNYTYYGLGIKNIISKCQLRTGNYEKWHSLFKKQNKKNKLGILELTVTQKNKNFLDSTITNKT